MTWRDEIQAAIAAEKRVAIVIGLSAGKDSTAVALLFKQTFPELLPHVHYVFADTGSELPETYEYLDKLEVYLATPIKRVMSKLGSLEHLIKNKFNGYLPSPVARYCTRMSKIVPFRDYMDILCETHDQVFNLVGIRADEPNRTGYEPCGQYAHKVMTIFPLADEGLKLNDVFKMVGDALGLPKYYQWRTRSGCTFCVPGDVEVLVEDRGWVRFDQYDGKDSVAQWDAKTETLSFVQPEALHRIPFKGDLIHVQSRLVDLMTTPDHRWIQKNKRHLAEPWQELIAEELPLQFFVPTSGFLQKVGPEVVHENLVRLAVAIQADGWITGQRAILGFSKQRKIDRLLELAERAGVEVRAIKPGTNDKARFSISIEPWQGVSFIDIMTKQWTWDVLALPQNCREALIDELQYWDSQNVTEFGSFSYLSAVESNAEIIQTLAHTTNYIASKSRRENGQTKDGRELELWIVNIQRSKNYTMVSERNHHTRVPFDGLTYCVTVPTGAFMIRSKGKILITGNCFYQRRVEWVGLKENHPELFEHAKTFEKGDYTWIKGMTLGDIENNADAIKARYVKRLKNAQEKQKDLSLTDSAILERALKEEDEEDLGSCSICR